MFKILSGTALAVVLLIVSVIVFIALPGCSATGMSDEDVSRQITLWQGAARMAVDVVRETASDATLTVAVETDEGEAALKEAVTFKPPIRIRMNLAANVKPQKQ